MLVFVLVVVQMYGKAAPAQIWGSTCALEAAACCLRYVLTKGEWLNPDLPRPDAQACLGSLWQGNKPS